MNRYGSYKPSEIDWVGEIPTHWETVQPKYKLNRVTRPIDNEDEVITCFRDGVVTLRKNRREDGFTNSIKEHGYQQIHPGDLVVHEMDGFAGAIGISDSKGKSTPVYTVVEPDDRTDLKYIAYLLREMSQTGKIESLARSIRERTTDFRWNMWSVIHFPFPPVTEQKLISCYLDKKTSQIDSLVEKIQKKIELLKEQRTSLINHYVTKGLDPDVEMKDSGVEWIGEIPKHWSVKTLKRIGNRKSGDGFKIDLQGREDGQVPFYKVSDTNHIGNEIFLTISNNYLNEEEVKDNKLRKFPSNTIIFPKIGEVLKLNKRRITTKECCIDNNMMGFLPFSEDLTKFIYFFMTLVNFEWYCSDGTIPSISETQVGNIPFISPPKEEQNHIVSKIEQDVERLDRLILLEQQRTNKLFEYRQSLISSVVTGKVRVTEDMI